MLDSLASRPETELHAALAEAGVQRVVVCASHRQAQALHEAHAQWRVAQGSLVWETPAILSFNAFTAQLHECSRITLPPRIGDAQARVLWRLCVDETRGALPLLQAGDTAALAAEAWQLCHDYRLRLPFDAAGVIDVERFNAWAQDYRRRLDKLGVLDAALFDDALLACLRAGELAVPDEIVLAGFEDLTPRLLEWLQAFAARGLVLRRLDDERPPVMPQVCSASDGELELRAAAQWARSQLEQGEGRRIAVVVPDIGARRAAVQRIFDEQLCPQADAPDAHSVARPYDLTLGVPLTECAPLQTALQLLRFASVGLDAATRSTLFASNHWGADEDTRLLRCAFDARLRREGWLEADLATLLPLAPAALRDAWRALAAQLPSRRQAPSEWAESFMRALTAAHWPGPRALDSEEFQQLARWRELLLEFASLDRVLGRVPLSAAVSSLRELAERTLFQPQAGKVALQVMGVLEAQGLHFDALWVTGVDDERWPAASRPHPFIPHALQRRHGLPHASAQRELAYARAQLEGWRRRSAELVLSYASKSEGRELAPSPLLAEWLPPQANEIEVDAQPASWTRIHDAARLETVDDAYAPPPLSDAVLGGGTRALGDQARCPFRAYAAHRLGARSLETPGYGLDAIDRGVLVHRVLELLWSEWRDQANLLALSEAAQREQVAKAVGTALDELQQRAPQRLQPVLRELEAQRLLDLVNAWLEVEKARPPFRVLSIEKRVLDGEGSAEAETDFEGLRLRLRPDRVDMDEMGRRIVLDYKTGARKPPPWANKRPEDPQLLVYALTEPDVGALAFARLAAGDIALQGLACEDSFGPGIAAYSDDRDTRDVPSWSALHGRWRGELKTLADEIRKGWAAVSPRHPRQSCQDCGLHAVCRIREQVSLDEGEEVAT